ncbi:AAA family ATPase [Lentzea chajnantorensis]
MVSVLWICGPPGVGKTVVGWEVHRRNGGAYVDVDQLGICYPDPDDDPGRYRMKARNLAAVVAGARASGVRSLVVSGVADPNGAAPIPGATLTVCRLRADREVLRERYLGRGMRPEQLDHVLREADELDARAIGDVCVDTTGLSVTEVADRVERAAGDWAGPERVLWFCGTTGVGKSVVGFAVYLRLLGTGMRAGFVDAGQLGFGMKHARADTLAAVWRTYQEAGARVLVVVGPYADVFPGATVYRLEASRADLVERIRRRGRGEGWPEPGDPLAGRSEEELDRVVEEAVAQAGRLRGIGTAVDTSGRTAEEVAASLVP